MPEPGWHDLLALTKRGAARIDGDCSVSHLQYFKDLLAAPRRLERGALMPAKLEPIVGRYMTLALGGREHRVYFEEAGTGIPLVCLHTAGADGRQFRHLMLDEAVTRHYPRAGVRHALARQVAAAGGLAARGVPADHGRLHRDGGRVLRSARAAAAGGDGLLDRRAHRAQPRHRARGVASARLSGSRPPTSSSRGTTRPGSTAPTCTAGGCAALVSGLIAPQSPDVSRHETLWMYKQGGPGVFKGDLYFYRVDGDLRPRVGAIDTKACPLYLLTGEYDFSCTPEDTLRTAKSIAGAEVTVMKECGHFPMSENPAQFRRYILPVLDKIRGMSGNS